MAAVEVFADLEALLDAATTAVIRLAADSIKARGRFTWALSGGSTPEGLYRRLASGEARDQVGWPHVHLFWGDERAVPPSHPKSNYRMAKMSLVDHVPLPPGQVHRMRGEDDPTRAAAEYEALLRATLETNGTGGPGMFDLILLGIGSDGHTASLFPARRAGRETARWVVAEQVDAERGWRLTLTPPVLNAARAVIFLVAGDSKATALAAVLEGPAMPDTLPAQRVVPRDAVRWMVDRQAAARLTRPPGDAGQ
jgi:6-phosphogluconolactonase